MSRIRKKLHVELPFPWSAKTELIGLVLKAGNLFIWAATAIRFVGDRDERDPVSQLNILLDIPQHTARCGCERSKSLDTLYMAILSRATTNVRSVHVAQMRTVIGTIVRLRSEMPLDAISQFLKNMNIPL